jgi:hypothetical protein
MDRRSFVVGALGVLAGAAFTEAQAAGEPALALLSGHHWPGTVVSYGFPAAGFAWGSTYGSRGFQRRIDCPYPSAVGLPMG